MRGDDAAQKKAIVEGSQSNHDSGETTPRFFCELSGPVASIVRSKLSDSIESYKMSKYTLVRNKNNFLRDVPHRSNVTVRGI